MEIRNDIHSVVKEIKEAKNSGTEESFIIMVSHILMKSGIGEISNIHQVLYFAEIPLEQGISILNKLEYLLNCKKHEVKGVVPLIEKLRFKFNISQDDSEQFELIIRNEFKLNHLQEYLEEHDEIDYDSFILGFIACLSTCID